MNRTDMLARLERETWDLLIIGGGISGAGVAREAAARGLKVALVEQGDFAGGTSSRSGKMIIGGLRYLLQREFHLVRQGIRERDWLAAAAPHLMRWTPYLFPVWRGDPDALLKVRFGLTLYDWFGAGGARKRHRYLRPDQVCQENPGFRREGLCGAAEYQDGMTDDARLVLETLQVAVQCGAAVANYAGVVRFEKSGGRIAATVVRDRFSGAEFGVCAGTVLAAGGPWTDVLRRLDDPSAVPLLRHVKGSFVVLPHERLPVQRNVTLRAPDNRMTFAVPWGGCTYLGTTEVDHPGPGDEPRITRAEVDYLLAAGRRAFPDAQLGEDDIVSTWAGLRPLVGAKPGQSPSQVKRDFSVSVSDSGLAVLAGGKLTGFRAMAATITDRLFPATLGDAGRKEPPPFPGSGAVPDISEPARRTGVAETWLRQRTAAYGSQFTALAAELPAGGTGPECWLRAQTRLAVKQEMAQTLTDVLRRRTVLMLVEKDNALSAAPVVADEMVRLLTWSDNRRQEELSAFRAEVAAMHAWRDAAPPRPAPSSTERPQPCELHVP